MTLDQDQIKFIGLDEVTEQEKEALNQLSTEYFPKIKRATHNATTMEIHVKAHEKEGNRRKWSIHAKALSPGHTFISNKAIDWDFKRAVHKAFNDILFQIDHKLGKESHKTPE